MAKIEKQVQDQALRWNSEIDASQRPFEILPEGTIAAFEVTEFEQGTVSFQQLTCPQAKLKLVCEAADGRRAFVRENLTLSTRWQWKLALFFRCIGQRVSGERIRPDWAIVKGARGTCVLGIERWRGREGDERESNVVKRFLDPAEVPTQPEQGQPEQGQPEQSSTDEPDLFDPEMATPEELAAYSNQGSVEPDFGD